MDPSVFPEEIWIKILKFCSVTDILSFGCSCKYLKRIVDTEYLWKLKWQQLEAASPFQFPDRRLLQKLSLCFKQMCYRMNMIVNSDDVFVPCYHCAKYMCGQSCVEDHGSRVVMDIGNKWTWIVTPNFGVRRHYSMFGIPKPSFDAVDSCSVSETGGDQNQANIQQQNSHETRSLHVQTNGPFCVFCNPVKLYREKKRVSCGVWERNASCRKPSTEYAGLANGFCADTVEILGIPNMDVVSPAAALLSDSMFHVVKAFVGHLFHQMSLSPVLLKPNAILMFCEPLAMSHALRIQLLHYLFLHARVSRVCLVPKPLAVSALVALENCIVIDSGALSTSVSVVLNGQLEPGRWRQMPIGGWHVAENLKQAMQWQPEEYTEIPISYLDTMTVKKKCRLSYNFVKEQQQRGPSRREDINLRVDSYADYKQYWRVSLGEELFLAPEVMYASLDLPQIIKDITEGLPDQTIKSCLGHILITGGNTDLSGFRLRIMRDLCELFPEFKAVINVQSLPGSSSWSVAMGSTYVPVSKYCVTDQEQHRYIPGMPFWMSREEYILYGCEALSFAC
ncbi:hypothetical protein R5R35_004110 [Gryllus longicercus]|uniref:F-box domain-containing protein n=1 Tax=Gryllus longicercus TaxID=2509291 RepID=A0AAN9VG04_9ORTH